MKRKYLKTGLAIMVAGFVISTVALTCLYDAESLQQANLFIALTVTGMAFISTGLGFSIGEIAKSVVKRLKESRERDRLKRDRQRQARRNKDGPASP